MRLTAHQVDLLAFEIARDLIKAESVEADLDHLADLVKREIVDELKVEDDLDVEVHRIVKGMSDQLAAAGGDYAVMFEKVKKQLVRERHLVL